MQTLKIKYHTTADNSALIHEYRRQYAVALHSAYNRATETPNEKYITEKTKHLNGTPLLDSWFLRSAIKEALQLQATCGNKLIFGGKKNFLRRCQGKISKDEFLEKRLSPLYSVGEAAQKGNRKFRIGQDGGHIVFQPDRKTKIDLVIDGSYKKYRQTLSKLYQRQEAKQTPISYRLDGEYIYISFDETTVCETKERKTFENRVFAVDLNPNYVGWSVTDWRTSGDFTLVASGVISIKEINDREFALKGKGLGSDSAPRKRIHNKRVHEVYEVARNLVNKALHYRCELFAVEELSIRSSDKERGSRYNRLCNNMWNRVKMTENIRKRCNMYGLCFMAVRAEYSSFVGNFLYRDLGKPDMVLSSVEIGRRAYEYHGQYIVKTKETRKNIVIPDIADFSDRYRKSSEEFGVSGEVGGLVDVYYSLKKAGCRYRLSLEDTSTRFSRWFSKASLVLRSV